MISRLSHLPSLFTFLCFFFFFNDTATTEIYTLSLHDALPIFCPWVYRAGTANPLAAVQTGARLFASPDLAEDRKSTRLNSSHSQISYAVFCLKKKKNIKKTTLLPEQIR